MFKVGLINERDKMYELKTIKDLQAEVVKFRDDRDWKQFHRPKDLAISVSLEAAELLEHFQWKTDEEINDYIKANKEEIADELADVFNYLLLMSHNLEIDLLESLRNKINKNAKKYPVSKSKGVSTKYNKL